MKNSSNPSLPSSKGIKRHQGDIFCELRDGKIRFLFICLVVWTAAVYAYRLDFPQEMYYDEVYHVQNARDILGGKDYPYVVQPYLGKLLIGLGMVLFGDQSWAWRIFPAIAGLGCLLMVFLLAVQLTASDRIGLFAALLLAFDGISLTQARIGMLNTVVLFWMLLSLYFLLRSFSFQDAARRRREFLLSGLFFGLALSTKMSALSYLFLLIPLLYLKRKSLPDQEGFWKEALLFLFAVPFLIYVFQFVAASLIAGKSWAEIWKDQQYMFHYHLTLKRTHRYGSSWWSWPLMIRPIWYFFKRTEGMVQGILCIGNPAVFLALPAVVGFGLWAAVKRKSQAAGILLLAFFTQWMFYALGGRVKFFHYFDMALPFALILAACGLEQIWCLGKRGKVVVLSYMTAVAVLFCYWYPLLTGLSIPEAFYRHHLWFRSWI